MTDSTSDTFVRSPQNLLGAIPYVLGYHPADEVVALYLSDDQRVLGVAAEPLRFSAVALAEHLMLRAPADPCTEVALVSYGPSPMVRSVTARVGQILNLFLRLHTLLLVTDSRCECILAGCSCSARNGIVFDPANNQIATQLTVEGRTALPSRRALVGLLAPDLVGQAETEAALAVLAPDVAVTGLLGAVLADAKQGQRLTPEQLAPLALALTHHDVLQTALHSVCARMWQRDLWFDVVRRVPDRYVTGPATLAAWSAWRRDDHALAEVALNRATQESPDDRLTRLVGDIVRTRIPAHRLHRAGGH
ncbi:DUF4192 domain-containing protein [Actinoplanes sp. LDG1-06]|uniref:DUF4192 domain-containing protein n=1 Tax=Paractinoplanes ovalisporus TaxID=2810368 RepID=A0ABS2AUC7_9ACTN|nr:DUF4192 domain-containing protein [Actinoplanes ovalisporus]MBM2623411.1 DUF4192 domain-containing protein [Actinoplanes ovalisporus]